VKKTKNKWVTDNCPSCGEAHLNGYSGKLNKDGEEYVICERTQKVCFVRNVLWRKSGSCCHTQESLVYLGEGSYICPKCNAVFPHYEVEENVIQLIANLQRIESSMASSGVFQSILKEAIRYIKSHD
jgi:uncharacterized C2H2 Zn-finger protein